MPSPLFTLPFVLLLLQFLAISTVAALFFPLQHYLEYLGVPAAARGFILGADALAALVTQALITPLVSVRSARSWLRAGVVLLAPALLLEGMVTSATAFTAARLLQGVGFICVVAALMPLFALCIPPGMSGRAFGWISLTRLIPYALVPPLFELLGINAASFGLLLRRAVLLPLLIALLLWRLPPLPEETATGPVSSRQGLRHSLGERDLVLLLVATTLLYAGYAITFFFLKGWAQSAGLGGSGTFFTLATAMMMVVRFGGGLLFDRVDKRRISTASLLLAAAATACTPWCGSTTALLLLALPCGLGWGIAMPLLNALIFDVSRPEARGLNQNLAMLMLQGGFFLGPLCGGWLLPVGGYAGLFIAAGVMTALAGLCTLAVPASRS